MTRDPWAEAKAVIGEHRVTLGPQASRQWLDAPEHLAMVLARYRAASALIGDARDVLEVGCGEGIGAGILAAGRAYVGIDTDRDAVAVARRTLSRPDLAFEVRDATRAHGRRYDAAVSLDVIEHIPAEQEEAFLSNIAGALRPHGACVIGTPNAAFFHLAGAESRAGHINNYSAARLHALLARHFAVVQAFGMQDVTLHVGHPEARHYLLLCGIAPRRSE